MRIGGKRLKRRIYISHSSGNSVLDGEIEPAEIARCLCSLIRLEVVMG